MTTEKHAPFVTSIENTDFHTDYSYLLNFWYTSKINKEFEFISRNGIHPDLRTTINDNKNGMRIVNNKITSISTAFYSAFRIMLDKLFENVKITKQRELDYWNVKWEPESNLLDINTYNLCYYALKNMTSPIGPINIHRPYRSDNFNYISIQLSNKDKLQAKYLLDSLGDIEEDAKRRIDGKIFSILDSLIQNTDLKHDLDLSAKKAVKKKKEPELVSPRPEVVELAFEQDIAAANSRLLELIPIYNSIINSIQGIPERSRFSYVLQYAKAGTNPNIRFIQDTETNYRNFMILVRQQTQAA